jgi:hypothetical protein
VKYASVVTGLAIVAEMEGNNSNHVTGGVGIADFDNFDHSKREQGEIHQEMPFRPAAKESRVLTFPPGWERTQRY